MISPLVMVFIQWIYLLIINNIHNEDKSLHEAIPIKKNRLILTRNSSTTFHSVSPWLSKDTNRKSYYITSEFKNFGRNKDRSPIDATELWINT